MKRVFRAAWLSLLAVAGGVLALGVGGVTGNLIADTFTGPASSPGLDHEFVEVGVTLLALLAYAFVVILFVSRTKHRSDLKILATPAVAGEPWLASDVVHRVQANREQMQGFYNVARNHARYSFVASLAAATIGLVALLFAVVAWQGKWWSADLSWPSAVSAAFSEFLGASFFMMYRKSATSMDRILSEIQVLERAFAALSVASTMTEGESRERTLGQVVALLVGPAIGSGVRPTGPPRDSSGPGTDYIGPMPPADLGSLQAPAGSD